MRSSLPCAAAISKAWSPCSIRTSLSALIRSQLPSHPAKYAAHGIGPKQLPRFPAAWAFMISNRPWSTAARDWYGLRVENCGESCGLPLLKTRSWKWTSSEMRRVFAIWILRSSTIAPIFDGTITFLFEAEYGTAQLSIEFSVNALDEMQKI